MSTDALEEAMFEYQIEMGMTIESAPSMDDHRNVVLAFQSGWEAGQAALTGADNEGER